MLAAAVAGEVFASPSEDAVLAAIRAATGPAGCLLVVMNYTGDRLNFGAAAERAKAEGLEVEMVVTADDCALEGKPAVGRRGIAGARLRGRAQLGAAPRAGMMRDWGGQARGRCCHTGPAGPRDGFVLWAPLPFGEAHQKKHTHK